MEIPSPGYTGNISPNATHYYANGSVVFWASASGCVAPYTYTWTFGDGTHSNLLDVTHVYPGPGYYSGSLIVDDSAGHTDSTYFCINASAWPTLIGDSGNPAPACP
jgi:PKD repeat protein